MIKINLKPDIKKKRTLSKNLPSINVKIGKNFILLLTLIVLIIAEIGYYILLKNEESNLIAKREYLLSEKNRLRVIEAKVRRKKEALKLEKELKENLELRKKIFVHLSKQKGDFIPMLSNLGNSILDGIWLKEIKLSRTNTSVKGFSFNPLYISSFYKNLNKYFSDVSLDNVQKINTKEELTYYNFKIKTSSWKRIVKRKEGVKKSE